jgi:hypothetical protein
MNERIRELADKIWAEEYWDKPNTDKLLPAQLNRFAELIVKECAQVAFEGDLKRAIGQWGSHSDILKHFEVEHDVVKTFRS